MNKNLLAQASAKCFKLRAAQVTIGLVAAFVFVALIAWPNLDVLLHAQLGELRDTKDVEGYFWMPNMGWVNMQDPSGDHWGVGIDLKNYKAMGGLVDRAFFEFWGYAWAPNFGWMSFNDGDGNLETGYSVKLRVQVGDEHPENGNGPWAIDGYAWAPNIGWIDFDALDSGNFVLNENEPQVTLDFGAGPQNPNNPILSAKLEGYAWSPNAGWVDLSEAKIPAWKDTTDPRIINWTAVSEEGGVQSEPYSDGLYIEDWGDYSPFGVDNFIWVHDEIKFKVQVDSQDNQTRFQDLYISNPTLVPGEIYYWKDRIKYLPGDPDDPSDNRYSGHYDEDMASNWFQPNPDSPYDEDGKNPTAEPPIDYPDLEPVPPEAWQPGDSMNPNDMPIWGSGTHFYADAEGFLPANVTKFELRVNARDAGGNYACAEGTFEWGSWADRSGCRFPEAAGPLDQRVGMAIDYFEPTGQLFYGFDELQDDDHIRTNVPFTLTSVYGDAESGAYHNKISWSLDQASWQTLFERKNNDGRDPVWIPFAVEFGSAGNDGDHLYLQIEVWDNVGNKRERILDLIIDNTPPGGDFEVRDPKDASPERTRFQYGTLYVPPPTDDTHSVSFSNDKVTWTAEIVYGSAQWPTNQPLVIDKWNLQGEGLQDVMPGGNRVVYAKFLDKTHPPNPVEVPYIIKAPWFEAQSGDIHANEGIGTTEDFPGVAPYGTENNATWRITSGDDITRQVTSRADWETDQYADLGYPEPGGSIADIDFGELEKMADGYITENDILSHNEINLGDGKILIAKVEPGANPVFRIGDGSSDITIKGRGTLLVDGSVWVRSNVNYEDELVESVRDIDSMGILTKRSSELSSDRSRGNLYIDQSVNHLVGSYILGLDICQGSDDYCNDTGIIHTAVDSNLKRVISSNELALNGLVVARGFDLNRYSSGSQNFLRNANFMSKISSPHPLEQSASVPAPKCPAMYGELPPFWRFVSNPIGLDFGVIPGEETKLGSCMVYLKSSQLGSENMTLQQEFSIPDEADIPENIEDFDLTISVYMRAEAELEGFASLSINQTSCGEITLDRQWRRYECTVPKVEPGKDVIFNLNMLFGQFQGTDIAVKIAAAQAEYNSQATAWHTQYGDSLWYSASSEHFFYDGRAVMNTPPGFSSVSKTPWGESVAD
ncbi:hypothetical protein ACFL0Z_00990 [Patescibacteria group bacterium]